MSSTPIIVKRRPSRQLTEEEILESLAPYADSNNNSRSRSVEQPVNEQQPAVIPESEEQDGTPSPVNGEETADALKVDQAADYESEDKVSEVSEEEEEEDATAEEAVEVSNNARKAIGGNDDAVVSDTAAAAGEEEPSGDAAETAAEPLQDEPGAPAETAQEHEPQAADQRREESAPIPLPLPEVSKESRDKLPYSAKVNLKNVENVQPIPEGVNTPRSVALCRKQGIKCKELRPRSYADFASSFASEETTTTRLASYEARRQRHMSILLPLYEESLAATSPAAKAPRPTAAAPDHEEAADETEQPSTGRGASPPAQQQRQQAHPEPTPKRASKGRSPAPATPSYRGWSARSSVSPSVYSAGTSEAGTSAAAVKILSRCKLEEREPTAAEQAVLNEIEERELRRLEALDRACSTSEARTAQCIERALSKERQFASRRHEQMDSKEEQKRQLVLQREQHRKEVERRRRRLEKERQKRISRDVSRSQERGTAVDPYATLLAKRKPS